MLDQRRFFDFLGNVNWRLYSIDYACLKKKADGLFLVQGFFILFFDNSAWCFTAEASLLLLFHGEPYFNVALCM